MKKTLLALLTTQLLFSHPNPNQTFPEYTNEFFIEAGIGNGSIEIDNNIHSTELSSGTLDNSPLIKEIGFGYGINENLYTGIHYQHNSMPNITLENTYLNLNYMFHLDFQHDPKYEILEPFRPFVGFLVGTSTLTWNKTPILGAVNTSSSSQKYFYGLEFGAARAINKNLFLNFKYQLSEMNHKTVIGNETLYHHQQNGFIFSISYKNNFFK